MLNELMQFALQTAFVISSAIFVALTWRPLNRLRGSDTRPWYLPNKAVILTLMGMIVAIPTTVIAAVTYGGHFWLLGIPLYQAAATNLLFRPSWGEIFTDANDTYMEKFAALVKPVTSRIVGFKYNTYTANDDREIFWKVVAWAPRIGIYGLPTTVPACLLQHSLLPALTFLLAAVWVGIIYRKNTLNHKGTLEGPTPYSERESGFFLGAVITLLML